MTELVTLLGDREIGRLRRSQNGRLSFQYDERWQNARAAYPLSLSMPLASREHRHAVVEPYLWGLLPDNELIVQRWARRFQVSPRNAFALLANVGEDCAGAVRFVQPDRLASHDDGAIEWLDEAAIAERLRGLHRDESAWRADGDAGQFSLAGAQSKTALLFDGGRWGVPSGRIPTTHILKPGAEAFEAHAHNEHFCLALARALGMVVTASRVEHFQDEVAIVVERYDRLRTAAGIVRVHQEDLCQALAVHPANKYENDGGPGARAVVEFLRSFSHQSRDDVARFVEALAFNWLIAGTDAHAKNYSVLLGAAGKVRLAPLYDVASALPYSEPQFQKLKLAMKIGGKYRLRDIGVHEWSKLATQLGLDRDVIIDTARNAAQALPDLVTDIVKAASREGWRVRLVERLADAVRRRAIQCSAEVT